MEASNILSCGLEAGEAVMKSKNGDVFWALTAALFSRAWKLSAVITPVYRRESGGPEPALWVSSQHVAGGRNSGACDSSPGFCTWRLEAWLPRAAPRPSHPSCPLPLPYSRLLVDDLTSSHVKKAVPAFSSLCLCLRKVNLWQSSSANMLSA